LRRQPAPHVGSAYVIASSALAKGLPKFEGVLRQFLHWAARHRWRRQVELWRERPPALAAAFAWTVENAPGLGDFMGAQIVADLKQTGALSGAPDWWTWAVSGPGSRRGLNRLLGRAADTPWDESEWLDRARLAQGALRAPLDAAGLPPLDLQGVQHNLCEFDKMERVFRGEGKSKRKFNGQTSGRINE
jgi:hypothetical protein